MTAAQEWMLEGMEQGLEKGLAKGREESERAALASILTKQARLRIREVPAETIARIDAAKKADLEPWLERFVTAESLDALFA